ncbi:MAG TPA: hypothetical protein PLI12_10445 [Acetobacteraceae bacterium]|nr:hypothetical protein [Acetobacteraceae bacterium]HQU02859.1 hypothetical protein [Acetobacteraceae bacterium]
MGITGRQDQAKREAMGAKTGGRRRVGRGGTISLIGVLVGVLTDRRQDQQ